MSYQRPYNNNMGDLPWRIGAVPAIPIGQAVYDSLPSATDVVRVWRTRHGGGRDDLRGAAV
jgi:hypothetical protein